MNNNSPALISKLDINFNSQQIFSAIKHQAGAILLDSGTSTHPNARFDIILNQPLALLSFQNDVGTITTETETKQVQGCPFTLAQSLWQAHRQPLDASTTDLSHLPFIGGIAGWFSYDLGRSLEKLPTQTKPVVDMPDLFVGVYDWALILDRHQQTWYLVDHQPKRKRFDKLLNVIKQTVIEPNTFSLTSGWQANISKQDYKQKFGKVKNYLAAGDCYQINLTQRFSAEFKGDVWQAYQALTTANQAPFSAYINQGDCQVLSISPERFLHLANNKVETKPIKGTLPRCSDKIEDEAQINKLANSAKDKAENLMIVDLLRNDISRNCQAGSVKVPHLFEIESFNAVHHMVSTVTGQLLPTSNAFDLLRDAFPGGSITGAPKIRAMEIIEELEPDRRHLYCGSIGYIDWRGYMDTSITIRTLIAKHNQLHVWAGGGLVVDSEAESEYQETLDKLAKILPTLSNLR